MNVCTQDKSKFNDNLPLQQILSELLSEAVVDLPWAQNELLQQLETQHHPKHPILMRGEKTPIGLLSKNQIIG